MNRRIIIFPAIFLLSVTALLSTRSWAGEADTGRDLYLKYCSSCHGQDGKGNGSVTPVLKVKVPDLTLLKKNNKGVFPYNRVMSSIDGTRKVRGHGDPGMPVWGEVFKEGLKEGKYPELTTLLKEKVITEHIQTLQR
ncbi:MAG TPA: c-type cytochrome [Candidatus Binatia bacterium]|jgi:mono/diheme cytochrome c family protein